MDGERDARCSPRRASRLRRSSRTARPADDPLRDDHVENPSRPHHHSPCDKSVAPGRSLAVHARRVRHSDFRREGPCARIIGGRTAAAVGADLGRAIGNPRFPKCAAILTAARTRSRALWKSRSTSDCSACWTGSRSICNSRHRDLDRSRKGSRLTGVASAVRGRHRVVVVGLGAGGKDITRCFMAWNAGVSLVRVCSCDGGTCASKR